MSSTPSLLLPFSGKSKQIIFMFSLPFFGIHYLLATSAIRFSHRRSKITKFHMYVIKYSITKQMLIFPPILFLSLSIYIQIDMYAYIFSIYIIYVYHNLCNHTVSVHTHTHIHMHKLRVAQLLLLEYGIYLCIYRYTSLNKRNHACLCYYNSKLHLMQPIFNLN